MEKIIQASNCSIKIETEELESEIVITLIENFENEYKDLINLYKNYFSEYEKPILEPKLLPNGQYSFLSLSLSNTISGNVGRGQKKCICGNIVGVRTLKCKLCNQNFPVKNSQG